MQQNDKALLKRLKDHDVQFVVIGGVCGVLHGASMVTFDLDVCCPFTLDNLRKLELSVKDLHPFHRMTPAKLPFELSEDLASRLKNVYLQTDLGKLDCLSEVAGIGGYNEVLQVSEAQETSFGTLRLLKLEALIASKEAVGREKDLTLLKQLRAIKERTRKT